MTDKIIESKQNIIEITKHKALGLSSKEILKEIDWI